MENSRSSDKFTNLAAFSKVIFVHCPSCDKKASITTEFGKYSVPYPYKPTSKFNCSHCFKPVNDEKWYGPVILFPKFGRCKKCGSDLPQTEKKALKNLPLITATCKVCALKDDYETDYRLSYANETQATDPYFGLQLWYKAEFGNKMIWAYNIEHLEYLKSYLAAKLRTRVNGGTRSLVYKLPAFLTAAKNRAAVLKTIDRLIEKF